MKKGQRDRNSPTCTLSQNGYGTHMKIATGHAATGKWKGKRCACINFVDVTKAGQPCRKNSMRLTLWSRVLFQAFASTGLVAADFSIPQRLELSTLGLTASRSKHLSPWTFLQSFAARAGCREHPRHVRRSSVRLARRPNAQGSCLRSRGLQFRVLPGCFCHGRVSGWRSTAAPRRPEHRCAEPNGPRVQFQACPVAVSRVIAKLKFHTPVSIATAKGESTT